MSDDFAVALYLGMALNLFIITPITAVVGHVTKRRAMDAMAINLFLGPIIFLVVFQFLESKWRRCKHCTCVVPDAATVCKHCHRDL